jgi:hypothetical protein
MEVPPLSENMAYLTLLNQPKRKTYHNRRHGPLDDYQYHALYRFKRENVEWLSEHILGDDAGETRGGALTKLQRMEITLRYLSSAGFQSSVAHEAGVHRSTVSRVVDNTIKKIVDKAHLWVVFPRSLQQLQAAKVRWAAAYGFPCAVGAIDCTHIRIDKPRLHGDEFVHRKGFASLNVQATIDEK